MVVKEVSIEVYTSFTDAAGIVCVQSVHGSVRSMGCRQCVQVVIETTIGHNLAIERPVCLTVCQQVYRIFYTYGMPTGKIIARPTL